MPNPPIIWNGDFAKLLKNKLKLTDSIILDASVPGTLTVTGASLNLGNDLAANSLNINSSKYLINSDGTSEQNPTAFSSGNFYKMAATMPASNGSGIRLDLTTAGTNTSQTALIFELKDGATGTGNMFGINANLFTKSTSNNLGGNGNMAGFFQAYHGTNTTTGLRAGMVGFAANANASVGVAGIASDFPYAAGRYVGVHGRARNTAGSAIAGHFLLGSDLGAYTPPALTSALVCDSGGAGDMQTWLHNGSTQVQMNATGNFYFPGAGDIGAGDSSNDPGHVYTRNFFSGPTGSNTTPVYTFNGDLTTGIYRVSSGVIGVTTGGTERLRMSSAGIRPGVDDLYDLGDASFRWREGYFSDAVNIGATLTLEDSAITQSTGDLAITAPGFATIPQGITLGSSFQDFLDFYSWGGTADGSLNMVSTSGSAYAWMETVHNGTPGSEIDFSRARGTYAAIDYVNSGDVLGAIKSATIIPPGDGGGNFFSPEIIFEATEDHAPGAFGTRIRFKATPNGTTDQSDKLSLTGVSLDSAVPILPTIPDTIDFGSPSNRWGILYSGAYLDLSSPAGDFGFFGGGQFEADSANGNFSFYEGNAAGGWFEVVSSGGQTTYLYNRYPDSGTPTAGQRQMTMGFYDTFLTDFWYFGHSVTDNGIIFANTTSRFGTDTVLLGITSPTSNPTEGQVNIYWGDAAGAGDGAGNIGSPDGGTTMARPDKAWIKTFAQVPLVQGSSSASGSLDLSSTSHATKAAVRIGDNSDFYFGNAAADAQTNLGFSATSKRFVLAESGGRPIFQLVAAGSTNPLLYMTHFNGTVASPTSTTSGQQIGIVAFRGYASGTSTTIEGTQGAAIFATTTENWGTGAAGAQMDFNTTPNGSATATTRMRLTNDGALNLLNSTVIRTSDGTVSAPSYSFLNSTGDGLYLIGSNNVGMSINGVLQSSWDTNGPQSNNVHKFSAGDATTPGLSFIGDTNTGIYSHAADVLGIAVGGGTRARFTTANFISHNNVWTTAGTASAPSYSWESDSNSGIYNSNPDEVSIATNSTQRLLVDNSTITAFIGIVAPTYSSNSANVATTGSVRLANNEQVAWRNAGNTNNVSIRANTSDDIETNTGFNFSGKLKGVANVQSGTTYTTLASDYIVRLTNTGARTVTLIDASTVGDGYIIYIKDSAGTALTNNITVNTSASQTIDGAASATIITNYGVLRLLSTGSNWESF